MLLRRIEVLSFQKVKSITSGQLNVALPIRLFVFLIPIITAMAMMLMVVMMIIMMIKAVLNVATAAKIVG